MRRLLLGALAGLLAIVLAALWACPPAGAHALLTSSQPADGASVGTAPSEVRLTFTETPDLKLSVVHVLDASGRSVETGRAETVPDQPLQLRVPLGRLDQGTYTVSWRTTSAVDGHTTVGSVAFGVGVPAVPRGSAASTAAVRLPSPTAASVAGRWLFYAGLMLLVGAAVVGLIVGAGPTIVSRRALAASWLVAALGLVIVIADQRATARTSLSDLLGAATGRKLIVQAVALLLTGLAVAWAAWRRGRPALAAVGVTAAAVMLARAQAGHADASSVPWFTVGTQWLHLVAAGTWVGGLAWFLVALRRADTGDRSRLARRFSSVAGIALGVVLVSGSVRALDEVGAWSRFASTKFGVALLVKLGLFAALALLGAVNRFRHVPGVTVGPPGPGAAIGRSRFQSLRRAVRGEVAIATGILGATAVLAGLPPSASVAAASKAAPVTRLTVTGNDYGTSVRVRLVVTPGTPGPNDFDATVVDYDTGAPVSARSVTLRFQLLDRPDVGAAELALGRGGGAHWKGQGSQLSLAGRWNMVALVEAAHDAVEVRMELTTRPVPPPVDISRAPGLPDVYTITISPTRKVQAYLDPGQPGFNDVHMTVFEGQDELPLDGGQITAVDRRGQRFSLNLRRFGPGHFAGAVELVPGPWRFELQGDASDGSKVGTEFSQSVKG